VNEKNDAMTDQLPDRLSSDPKSPYYNADVLARDVGIRFKGVEKTNVEEYCVSEGWVRVTAATPRIVTATRSPSRCMDRWNRISATRRRPSGALHRGSSCPARSLACADCVNLSAMPGIHVFLCR